MSSKRRKLASRTNGRRSRGPVTPEGKARSSANATVGHGLSSDRAGTTSICLLNENREEFLRLYALFMAEHVPETITEEITVRELAVAHWRLERALTMEAALLDNQMEHMAAEIAQTYETPDEATRTTLAFRNLTEKSPSVAILHRYETRLGRQIDRCLKRLITLRTERDKRKLPREPNPTNEHQHLHFQQGVTHGPDLQPTRTPAATLPAPPSEGPKSTTASTATASAGTSTQPTPELDEITTVQIRRQRA